jgi:hypothetical protein
MLRLSLDDRFIPGAKTDAFQFYDTPSGRAEEFAPTASHRPKVGSLDRFACVLVQGEDRCGYNKIIPAARTSGAENPPDEPAFSGSQNQVGSSMSKSMS